MSHASRQISLTKKFPSRLRGKDMRKVKVNAKVKPWLLPAIYLPAVKHLVINRLTGFKRYHGKFKYFFRAVLFTAFTGGTVATVRSQH